MVVQTRHAVLMLIFFIFSSCASGAVIFVDNKLADDCTGNYSIANRDNSGSDGDAYNTAQEAADVSKPGDLICFRAGTYYE
ncbi:MAG: hypothetical protein JXA81_14150, partial [Sedimentisphaerales bacterium]|nr:hypothetical protein [Sedimentisphaerales bacterium]